MKKILLALMMMVSFSFAISTGTVVMTVASPPATFQYGGMTFSSMTKGSCGTTTSIFPINSLVYQSTTNNISYFWHITSDAYWNGSTVVSYCVYTYTSASTPTNPDTCDTLGAKYPSPSGQCVDCMPFTSFSQRASCACNAIGSSWTPQNVMSTSYTYGGYTYQKTNTECDNGTWVAVYYDPVPNTPTDNNNTTDNNSTTPPQDTNTTSPTDGNNSTTPTTPSQADVVDALKQIQNGQKDATTALKDVGVDVKAMRDQMDKNSLTYADILKSINTGNEKADKMYQLTDDMFKGQTQIKNTMGKWVDDFSKSATSQLNATVDVKNAVDKTTNAVNGTTNAVNAQGDKITGKLDDILNAIKDGNNSTDMKPTNDLLEKIKGDTNATVKGVDKLHDDLNTTNDLLGKIKDLLDFNSSKQYTADDLMPSGGEGWFTSNAINGNFNLGSSACYCESFEFQIAGKTFLFPSPELLAKIPFDVISNMFMAFIYVLGLRSFLRS